MTDPAHIPVLLPEVITGLGPRDGGRYVDLTVGLAGHAAAILRASGPGGWLWGCDRDGQALAEARARLGAEFPGRFELRHGTYDALAGWLPAGGCDGVLMDLGVSSLQLDRPERGFSFRQDGPLDMRMDPGRGETAADVVNHAPVAELETLFRELGEERHARRMARAVADMRQTTPFQSTRQLAACLERVVPARGDRIHPATRAFQALRMRVNDELGLLRRGLAAAWTALRPGGRLAVISFHSLEARVVKEFGRDRARDYEFDGPVDVPELRRPRPPELALLTRKPVEPSAEEAAANPRARSAQLRVFGKLR
ncbi:MAG: 16S rRNA (cytosine(1402)-N(4))-methyltransferase RsmH [Limisphaerales bacterium]